MGLLKKTKIERMTQKNKAKLEKIKVKFFKKLRDRRQMMA